MTTAISTTPAQQAYQLDLRVLRYRNRPGTDEPALLALELVAAGRTHDALDIVDDALKQDPDDLDVLLGCALAAVRTDRLAFAQLVLTRAAQKAPEWTEALTLLARVLSLRGCHGPAVEVARRAVAAGETDAAVREMVRAEDWRRTLETRLAALRADPSADEPALLAQELLAVDRTADALSVIELGLAAEDDADLRRLESKTRARLGDPGGARRALERALELAPGWWDATLDLTALLLESGHAHEALAIVERALDLAPDEGALLALQAEVLDAAGEAGLVVDAAELSDASTERREPTGPIPLLARRDPSRAKGDRRNAGPVFVERRRTGWLPRITRSLVGSRARRADDGAPVARA